MGFKIDKTVPIPKEKGKLCKYPFAIMNVGDSFLVGDYSIKLHQRCTSSARQWTINHKKDWKFIIRKVEADKLRCWRVK